LPEFNRHRGVEKSLLGGLNRPHPRGGVRVIHNSGRFVNASISRMLSCKWLARNGFSV
jgi:hypothetical protein